MASAGTPSPLFVDNQARLREAARLGPIADLACGRGRHARPAARAGLPVIGLDRDAQWLAELGEAEPSVARVRCDLESGSGLPLRAGACGAVLVFRYLHRPLAPTIAEALAPGGLLLYETFTRAQAELEDGPSNPAYLLDSGELSALFPQLVVLGYEECRQVREGRGEASARLVARRPG